MTFHIKRSETPDAGLRRIAKEQLGLVLMHFEDASLDTHTRIHSLRARCKKMRALLRLAAPIMGETAGIEDARYRDAARHLCGLRDDYVQRKTLAELLEQAPERPPESGDEALPEAVLRIRDGLAAIDRWPWMGSGFYDLAPGYGRTYAKGREAWQRVLRDRSDECFHRLRKWSKYLWYQTRILERMNRKALHRQRVSLQVAGELLGHAHDLALLESGDRVAVDKPIRQLAAKRKNRIYRRALTLCRDVYEPTTDQQVADLARWWHEWRRPDL